MSGVLVPDATGDYFEAGIYGGRPYYARNDSAFTIWWQNGTSHWMISASPDTFNPYWVHDDPAIIGDYSPAAGATGTATVS